MKKFFIIVALFAFVFANAASAQDIDVTFTVGWGNGTFPYDVCAQCILSGEGVEPLPLTLTANSSWTEYTGTFEDPDENYDSFKIIWVTGGYDWDDDPYPILGGDIWDGIDAETTASFQGG